MNYLTGLHENRILIAALVGWAVAQVLKTILYTVINHKFEAERLVGSGGMPSSHASTVCALATSSAIHFGTGSFEFAVTFILAMVVLYDARGVRFETGKQAVTIHAIIDYLKDWTTKKDEPLVLPDIKLKELVGHSPLQVLAGMALGIVVGLLVR